MSGMNLGNMLRRLREETFACGAGRDHILRRRLNAASRSGGKADATMLQG